MKKKKWLLPGIIGAILLIISSFIIFQILSDENKLTSEERTWINSNINNVQNIYVAKDENLFSKDGNGVFYDFLEDFETEYGLKINVVTFENSNPEGVNLNNIDLATNDSNVFYTDHYVLVSKNFEIIKSYDDLKDKTIGVLNKDLDYLKSYLKNTTINYKGYENIEELTKDLNNQISYIIIPRVYYLDTILTNNLEIIYHFSDINRHYVLNVGDDLFSKVIKKYFNIWQKNIPKSIKKYEFELFTKALNITESDKDKLLSIDYRYGFINNSPYEVIMSGNYGGIVAEYLQEFSEFSGVYFNITKYKNTEKLVRAINRGDVDLYFAFDENIKSKFISTNSGINASLSIITNRENAKSFNSIYGLQGETVYVLENSHLEAYLKSIGNIKILTYKNLKELFKLNNSNNIIVMDTYIYSYLSENKLSNYISKYNGTINNKYGFKVKNEYKTLNLLLDRYMNYLDNLEIVNKGMNSHLETISKGQILNNIAIYLILSIVGILLVGLLVYRKSKRIRIAKRIRKDDKIRFIDDLTCLKNRAYLSDFIKTWSNNTIYPQTIIVVDLNRLKEINDKHGVSEGDKQIQAAANALIKTQLDNSDLMRSDGNEFVIYTVGYSKKQIINYIHKLNKELKKMPYNYGAEFGYSIIENNLKTIEDALNEATQDMKNKKASGHSEK